MNAMQEQLFLELRQTKEEIEKSLKNKQKKNWLRKILEEELDDIDCAIKKLEDGNFGHCEISGEFLPEDLLKMIPTIKSFKDSEYLANYCKKTL